MILKRSLLIVMLVSLVLATPCLAKKQKGVDTGKAQIQAVLQEHNKAFNAQDLKGVMSTYSSDPDCVLMGTGPGEAYVGDEAIGAAYDQFFTKFEAGSLTFKPEWITAAARGNLAWFAVTTTVEGVLKQEKKERAFNMTGTLRKEKGKWRIISLHLSRLGAEQQ